MFTCISCLTGDTCVVTMCFCTFVYLDPDVFVYVTFSKFGLKLIVCYKCCQFVVIRRYLVVNVILGAFLQSRDFDFRSCFSHSRQ